MGKGSTLLGAHLLIMLLAFRHGGMVRPVAWKASCICPHSSLTMGMSRPVVPTYSSGTEARRPWYSSVLCEIWNCSLQNQCSRQWPGHHYILLQMLIDQLPESEKPSAIQIKVGRRGMHLKRASTMYCVRLCSSVTRKNS